MEQISIILRSKPGVLAEITEIMSKSKINIDNIQAETVGEYGIIVMKVEKNKCDLALKKLRDASFNAVTEKCLLIKLKDEPGALAKIANKFKDANINIRSLRILGRDGKTSIVAISTERTENAKDLVQDELIS